MAHITTKHFRGMNRAASGIKVGNRNRNPGSFCCSILVALPFKLPTIEPYIYTILGYKDVVGGQL